MSKSSLYQTITVSSGFFVYSLGFVRMYILTPIECFLVGTIFILLAILRYLIDKRTPKKPKVSTSEFSLEEFTFVDPPGYYTHHKYPYPICQNCLIKSKLVSPVSQIDENTWFCNICNKYFPGDKGEVFTVDW